MFAAARRSSILFVIILALAALAGCGEKKAAAPAVPDVEVAPAVQKDVPVYLELVASTDGIVNATIRAQVQGYLIKQNYKEGDLVKKGQVLFEIDPRTFQAALDNAKGGLAQQQARWETAKANLNRVRPLAAQNAVSQKDLDDAVGNEQSAHAAVLSAQAEVDRAEVNLGFTKVTSLIDGIAGIAKAQIGNLVGPGSTEELTTVSTVDPIKVYLPVSEQQYLKAAENRKRNTADVPLELVLADGTVFPHKGRMTFANREVDVKTGTIQVTALFPNPGNILRPGQFARVRAQVEVKKGALLIPQRAVSEMQGRYLVAVVGENNKVDIRPVKAGERQGSDWVIEEGLKPGERVVAEGIQKVRQDMTVNPKPFEAEKDKEPASAGSTIDKPAGEASKPAAAATSKGPAEAGSSPTRPEKKK